MKILLVNTRHYRGGGDSTYTFNLAELLVQKNHEVAFFAMESEQNIADPNSDLFVSHIDFKDLNNKKGLLAGLKVVSRAIYSVEAERKFTSIVKRFRPDIVHLQNIHAHITPSIVLAAKRAKLPVVWTLHDFKLICPNSHFSIDGTGEICEECGKGDFFRAGLRRCKKGSLMASAVAALEAYIHRALGVIDRVDYMLAPSRFLRDKFIDRGFPVAKVKHLPLFLPNEMFDDGFQDKGYLLYLGIIDPIKGLYPLLEACRMSTEVNLIMAGRAEPALLAEIAHTMPGNAEYIGMKSGGDLRQLLREARAIVLPSLWYENQPFSITEAFAFGKPAIGSKLGGIVELVKDGERGLLTRVGDSRELAQAMTWMSTHPMEARKMGENARSYALAEHGGEAHYSRLLNIYDQALKAPKYRLKS
jgi:glycosyltransferase involved in cell wall biosynthesis